MESQKFISASGEWVVTRQENDSIIVTKDGATCPNVIAALRDIAAECKFKYDDKWNTRQFGANLIKFLAKRKTYTSKSDISAMAHKDFLFTNYSKFKISNACENVKESLRIISDLVQFEYDPNWNTQMFGRKLIDHLGGKEITEVGEYTIVKSFDGSIHTYHSTNDIVSYAKAIYSKLGYKQCPKDDSRYVDALYDDLYMDEDPDARGLEFRTNGDVYE